MSDSINSQVQAVNVQAARIVQSVMAPGAYDLDPDFTVDDLDREASVMDGLLLALAGKISARKARQAVKVYQAAEDDLALNMAHLGM